jgi:hypothetical protein
MEQENIGSLGAGLLVRKTWIAALIAALEVKSPNEATLGLQEQIPLSCQVQKP